MKEHHDPEIYRPGSRPRSLGSAVFRGLASSVKGFFLLAATAVPVHLLVTAAEWSGILGRLSEPLNGAAAVFGLPGKAAVVVLASVFLNLYGAVAAVAALGLNLRVMTIVAVMALMAHNLALESALMKRTGSSASKMMLTRLVWAILAGLALNRILPATSHWLIVPEPLAAENLGALIAAWAPDALRLVGTMAALLLSLRLIRAVLEEFVVLELLTKIVAPFLRVFGLPSRESVPWMLANTASYGAASKLLDERIKAGEMKKQEADLFNHHAAVCHGLYEDTAMFMLIGVSLFWLTVPRLAIALVVVWFERARRHRFRRSFKVGTV